MTRAGQDARDDQNDTAGDAPAVRSAGNRRGILGAAAGGLVLAAGGLILPAWLEETEAREGALGGKLGGRHGKNRRGRNKRTRRGHGDKKNRDKHKDQDSPRGGPTKNLPIKFIVDVDGERSIRVEYYVSLERPGGANSWKLQESTSLPPAAGVAFAAPANETAVWIDDHILVKVNNQHPALPLVTIGHGGAFWDGERGWQGGTVVFADRLDEQASAPDLFLGFYGLRVMRLDDQDDYKRLYVTVERT